MSKKGYEDFAVIEYRIEKIVDKKIQLKNELNNEEKFKGEKHVNNRKKHIPKPIYLWY